MTGRVSHAPIMRWNAAFVDSRRVTAASVAARTGMPICCAMGARRPTPSGGSRMRPGDNNSSRRPPGSIVLAGESSVTRPPSRSTSNSRAFASVTSARLCSLRSSGAGLLLLLRILCPDGKKTWHLPKCHAQGESESLSSLLCCQSPFRQTAKHLDVPTMLSLMLDQVMQHPFRCHLIVRKVMGATEILQGHSAKGGEKVLTDEIEPLDMLLKQYSLNKAQTALIISDVSGKQLLDLLRPGLSPF